MRFDHVRRHLRVHIVHFVRHFDRKVVSRTVQFVEFCLVVRESPHQRANIVRVFDVERGMGQQLAHHVDRVGSVGAGVGENPFVDRRFFVFVGLIEIVHNRFAFRIFGIRRDIHRRQFVGHIVGLSVLFFDQFVVGSQIAQERQSHIL